MQPVSLQRRLKSTRRCMEMIFDIRGLVATPGQLTSKPFVRATIMYDVNVSFLMKPHSIWWLGLGRHQLGFGSM